MIKIYITVTIISVVVLSALGYAFTRVGSPTDLRNKKIDDERSSHLSSIRNEVNFYFEQNGKLPKTLYELNNDDYLKSQLNDPQTLQPYTYKILDQDTYQLCASFSSDSKNKEKERLRVYPGPADSREADFYVHPQGNFCFEATIPEYINQRYSSLTPTPIPQTF